MRISGRVNATDKDGRPTSEIKVLAETVELISDDMLENYQSTGSRLAAPVAAPKKRNFKSSAEKVNYKAPAAPEEPARIIAPPKDPRKERLYLLIENPEHTETLAAIRRLADINIGVQDVVLVLKDGEEKRPLKMPFRVDVSDELLDKLKELLGEDKVKVK